ncbi:hypothetical protein ABZ901_07325 [Actinacidiphila alni]|uniref:hypothetical protein n=1 Tax=Actinacidiphila alni TaxID=380248 RepID=UPI0033FB5018
MLTTALCAVLSAAGLAIAVQTAYRRRYLRATRIAAVALLPVGLAMAGLVTLGRKIGTASADWAADLIFKPTVWLGFGVIGVSALLYGATRLIAARGGTDGEQPPAAVPGASSPALPASSRPAPKRRAAGSGDSGLSDFADVEEILKRRGI